MSEGNDFSVVIKNTWRANELEEVSVALLVKSDSIKRLRTFGILENTESLLSTLLIEFIEVVYSGADLPNHPNVVADGGLPAEDNSAFNFENKIIACMAAVFKKKEECQVSNLESLVQNWLERGLPRQCPRHMDEGISGSSWIYIVRRGERW
jgi:hypothetical protein